MQSAKPDLGAGARTPLDPAAPESGLRKRSVSLAGHATSVALEAPFWTLLEALAAHRATTLAAVMLAIDAGRGGRPLASACRLAALDFALSLPGSAEAAARLARL